MNQNPENPFFDTEVFFPQFILPEHPVVIGRTNHQIATVSTHADNRTNHPMPTIILAISEEGLLKQIKDQHSLGPIDRCPTACVFMPIPGHGRPQVMPVPPGFTGRDITRYLKENNWFVSGAVWSPEKLSRFFGELASSTRSDAHKDHPATGGWERIVR